jgi:predicted dehydrogenase
MGLNGIYNRKLNMGLIGGGVGSFIGKVHSIAACLDNRAILAAGAFSSDPEKSKLSAEDYGVSKSRAYGSYQQMIEEELKLPDGQRIDFASITTPNHTHFPIAKAFLEAGFNVVCDKPMTLTLQEAEELASIVEKNSLIFGLTHNYTGYPLVRQAREMIQRGELGEIQAIRAFYIQGWLRTRLENSGQKQAGWRTDPKRSGIAGCFGDIATHAYNLARFVSGLLPDQVSCTLKTFEPGRELDDYGTAIIKLQGGALATVTASQISHGRENDLWIEVDGTLGALEWHQEEPNKMVVRRNGQPHQIYTRAGGPYLNEFAQSSSRLPAGHPEAFFEAFANVYASVFDAMADRKVNKNTPLQKSVYPNVMDGVDGMNFITRCVESSKSQASWVSMAHPMARP